MSAIRAAAGTEAVPRRSRLTPERAGELYDAVLDELRESGYDALTMDAVAARSHCSKATLYRQWQGKPQLVAAALRHCKPFDLSRLDTGSLSGDLHEVARRFTGARKDVELSQVIAPAVHKNPDLAEALREAVIEPELEMLREIVERAVARGEMAPDSPTARYLPHMLVGAVFARPFVERREADTAYLKHFLDTVVLPVLVRK
ncbi:TetR/AcrR family transcriptional regulator [Streptomyces sp. NPDC006012]|uniref:TetR/AcrR family transcriptional regulator n=1 Tax=Streptomyces sp. NPDC006012 TaxID=3364739 RepID=UPI003681A126